MNFITDNFNMLFNSEEGLKKLDEIILDLAVKGKLLSQDPTDEPASVLIEKIEEEKQKLISEKKIKKPKKLNSISKEEIPFEIPESWEWVKLGNLGNIFNGNSINKTLKSQKYEKIEKGLDYIATKDIDKESSLINYNNGIKIPFNEPKFKIACTHSVLICSEGGSAGKKIAYNDREICFGNKLFVLESYIPKISKYMFYTYKSTMFYSQFASKMTGIIGGISSNNFKELLIPLPPLEEQKRIVEKIDSLKKLIENLRTQVQIREKTRDGLKKSIMAEIEKSSDDKDLLKNLELIFQNFDIVVKKKEDIKDIRDLVLSMAVKGKLVEQNPTDEPASVLIEKIEEEKKKLIAEKKIKKPKDLEAISEEEKPFGLPESWEWVRLDNLSKVVEYGTSFKAHEIKIGIPVLRMGNIQNGKVDYNNLKYVSEDIKDLPKLYLNYGDLIFNRTNSYELVGKTAIFDKLDEKFTLASYLIRVSIFSEYLSSRYINTVMNSRIYRKTQIEPKIVQQNNQANYNGTKLKNTLIPLPPLAEQKRIVKRVDKLMELCDRLEEQVVKSQEEMKALMGSVMQLGK